MWFFILDVDCFICKYKTTDNTYFNKKMKLYFSEIIKKADGIELYTDEMAYKCQRHF